MAQRQGEDTRKWLDWDALQIPEQFETYSYVLTQKMIDDFRKGVMDPEAAFPRSPEKSIRISITRPIATTAP